MIDFGAIAQNSVGTYAHNPYIVDISFRQELEKISGAGVLRRIGEGFGHAAKEVGTGIGKSVRRFQAWNRATGREIDKKLTSTPGIGKQWWQDRLGVTARRQAASAAAVDTNIRNKASQNLSSLKTNKIVSGGGVVARGEGTQVAAARQDAQAIGLRGPAVPPPPDANVKPSSRPDYYPGRYTQDSDGQLMRRDRAFTGVRPVERAATMGTGKQRPETTPLDRVLKNREAARQQAISKRLAEQNAKDQAAAAAAEQQSRQRRRSLVSRFDNRRQGRAEGVRMERARRAEAQLRRQIEQENTLARVQGRVAETTDLQARLRAIANKGQPPPQPKGQGGGQQGGGKKSQGGGQQGGGKKSQGNGQNAEDAP